MTDGTEATGVLAGVRVIDLAQGLAGSVAALLLAEAGADVVKIEPPGGSPLRGTPQFAIWNRSKRAIRLDPAIDRDALHGLLAGADVLVHDLGFAEAKEIGLADSDLRLAHPHLIVCGVTGFPEGHEHDGLPARDSLVLAAAGVCDEQVAKRRDGPVYLRFPLGSWGAAWLAAIGVIVRLLAARKGEAPGAVRTSLFQGALLPLMMLWRKVEAPSPALAASPNKRSRPSLAECADGVWLHLMKAPDDAPLMKAALDALGPDKVKALNEEAGPQGPMFPNWGAVAAILKTRPSAEWLEDFWAADVSVQPATPMGQLYFDEQAVANAYVVPIKDPHFGDTLQPGAPYSMTPAPRVRGPAPAKADEPAAIRAAWTPRPRLSPMRRRAKPLEGVKVVDFGNFLAGPLAPMLMGDLGADVVKLESTSGDQMRWAEFAFLACQRNKRSIAAELKDGATREIVERLVADADVVHHNLRMPAARKLGLDYEAIRKINPRIVYCHVSSYGPLGPRKDWPGYDQLFQAASGWEYEGAGAGNPPMWHRFGMMDHQGALASLYATLLGLFERERTGEGQCVSASLLGASILTMSETLVADGQVAPYPKLDADQLGVSPQDRLYRCADGWIMLFADPPSLTAALEKFKAVSVADLEATLVVVPTTAAIENLRACGVTAVRVGLEQGGPFFDDPTHRALGLAVTLAHAKYGRLDQPGALWSFEGQSLAFERAPPVLGEHTREILAGLGFTPERIAAFENAKSVVSA